MTNEAVKLTDEDYQAALKRLADYEKHLIRSGNLEQAGSLDVAADLALLFEDPEQRWVAERNAERAATAKTERGGRPVDPTSRSQFSTWVRSRHKYIAPRRTYQLLDAHRVTVSYLNNVQISPETEASLRPFMNLLRPAYGGGNRIPPIYEIACHLAGHSAPSAEHVRQAISKWNEENLPRNAARHEAAEDRLRRKRFRAQEKIDELFLDAKLHPEYRDYIVEQLQWLATQISEDIAEIQKFA